MSKQALIDACQQLSSCDPEDEQDLIDDAWREAIIELGEMPKKIVLIFDRRGDVVLPPPSWLLDEG
jgi:hypothetical protein